MGSRAVWMFRGLEGLFAVYKPPGVHWKLIRDGIETNLLKGLNSAPPLEPRKQIAFLPEIREGSDGSTELTLTATRLPILANHPLVTGPQFKKLHVGVGHRLDAFSSGVLVLGVGQGNKMLADLCNSQTTRDYTVEGEFGLATEDFSHTGRLVERTTYDHITQDDLERVLGMIQGSNQKALITYSNIDLSSQQAYELAVKGSLYPQGKSPPILTGLRCLSFKPPYFTLEMQCVNETQRVLRRVVHEVGLELRSTAVCTGVRRTRDGPFSLQAALTHKHWSFPEITEAIRQSQFSWRKRTPKEPQPQNKNTEKVRMKRKGAAGQD
ncbi:mitochondrial mRNA pseudouridine synthase TRUB2 [Conger conger]|uniref:mitochondrial mRNA pseudouridine synthase TRUB2 n=1 Tax=Conger conger TaxID=82655 RepID=UPI002A5AE75E|nr:mitochondrial mRNA pseudouridine synthase TRUB2 [Conger conger]